MWIAKGMLLGVWLFSFGTIISFYVKHRGAGPGMFGIEALLPVSNPSFWLWLVACLALGGLWFFSFGSIAWLIFFQGYKPASNSAFDIRSLAFLTVSNPSWWLWLVACLCLGMIAARNYPMRGVLGSIVWIGLAVTELFPAAILAFILVVLMKIRQQTP